MNELISSAYLAPFLVSNAVAAGLILLAIKWPRLAHGLLVFVFLAAGAFNIYTALTKPESYLDYVNWATLHIYLDFINGPFAAYTQVFVLAIAVGQLSVAALLTRSGRLFDLGTVGGIIFFVAIAPLGIGSAFPSTLLMAIALFFVHRRLSRPVRSPQNS